MAAVEQIEPEAALAAAPKIAVRDLEVFYGDKQALTSVDLDIRNNQVTALIGPSGCGKSTFIRCLNRMNDVIESCRVAGEIRLDGEDIYARDLDVVQLRARVGMVFQKPNPFPKSVFDNVAYGPRIHGLASSRADLEEIVVTSLERAGLFEEVKDSVAGVSCGCADVFGGSEEALESGFDLIKDNPVPGTSGLPSLRNLAADGYTVMTF